MTRIRCVSCHKTFEWDEEEAVLPGGGLAKPHAAGAVRLSVACPLCHTNNAIWVKEPKVEVLLDLDEDEP